MSGKADKPIGAWLTSVSSRSLALLELDAVGQGSRPETRDTRDARGLLASVDAEERDGLLIALDDELVRRGIDDGAAAGD